MQGNGGHSISHPSFTIIIVDCQKETLWLVYDLWEVALFLEEENLVHDEHFCNEHFVSKSAYWGDIQYTEHKYAREQY
jgi:hypothetical protein